MRNYDIKNQPEKMGEFASNVARERAETLISRLGKRMAALEAEAQISARMPLLKGGALIIPMGLIHQLKGETTTAADAASKKQVELLAMQAVMDAERSLGRMPKDVSEQRGIGYDIESVDANGNLFFIEVKGRAVGADSVTLTYNELKCGNNKPKQFRLAICQINNGSASPPMYVSHMDWGRPGFGAIGQTFSLQQVLQQAQQPH